MKERVPAKMNWVVRLLCCLFPYKEIGWQDIDEVFFRWVLVSTPWFKVVLHRLDSERWHSQCHDHPWDFWAFIIKSGYLEILDPKQNVGGRGRCIGTIPGSGNKMYFRPAGSLLYRPAETKHNVLTKQGRPSWSIVIMKPKRRNWGFMECEA